MLGVDSVEQVLPLVLVIVFFYLWHRPDMWACEIVFQISGLGFCYCKGRGFWILFSRFCCWLWLLVTVKNNHSVICILDLRMI